MELIYNILVSESKSESNTNSTRTSNSKVKCYTSDFDQQLLTVTDYNSSARVFVLSDPQTLQILTRVPCKP
jgi:hypothetical protein